MSGIPFGSFGFTVELSDADSNLSLGCFQEVSGLGIQINVTDLVEGGVNNKTHKLVGNASYPNVTLKRGLIGDEFYAWISDVRNGIVKRKTITIKILGEADKNGKVASKSYKIMNALPVNWSGPALNVMQDAIATESLELAHEGLTLG